MLMHLLRMPGYGERGFQSVKPHESMAPVACAMRLALQAGSGVLSSGRATETMPMPAPSFRFPGVLNSQELLVAEAIQARAWESLRHDDRIAVADDDKAKLGSIVVRLMADRSKSIGDLAMAAIEAFKAPWETRPPFEASPELSRGEGDRAEPHCVRVP
ncbi:hypothetical protein BH10PSE8_BH10PSE8_07250 [soil metagenome]